MIGMILETERLLLDTWQSADWTAFRPIATDPEVMRYVTGGVPWSDDQIQSFVDRQAKLYLDRGYCRWKLVEKTGGETMRFFGGGEGGGGGAERGRGGGGGRGVVGGGEWGGRAWIGSWEGGWPAAAGGRPWRRKPPRWR